MSERIDKVTRSVNGLTDALGSAARAARSGVGADTGRLDPAAVAEALDQYLKSNGGSVARSIANSLGALISKAIRGRGQIDFRRTT